MANTIPKVPHLIGENKIAPLEDIYQDIGAICGIVKLNTTPPEGADTYTSIRQLSVNGTVRKAKVRLSNKKIRVIYVLAENCGKIGALRNKNYTDSLTITSAYFPQQYRYG